MTTAAVTPFVAPKAPSNFLAVTDEMVDEYWRIFINRRAYLQQRHTPGDNGKFSYYAPKVSKDSEEKKSLTKQDVRQHLEGKKTISLYAIEPENSTCKWIAIDADYDDAEKHLVALKYDLEEDGIQAIFESSRRGGHIWVLAEDRLPADKCRLLIYNIALRLNVPIKGFNGAVDGIEIFPRQDRIEKTGFGNAIRGPLGVHRAVNKRFWFRGVTGSLKDQFAMLKKVKRLTLAELEALTDGLTMPEPDEPAVVYTAPAAGFKRQGFEIHREVKTRLKIEGRNYSTRCPSCAAAGRDRGGDNLKINRQNPYLYQCFAGCHKNDIRAALGFGPAREM